MVAKSRSRGYFELSSVGHDDKLGNSWFGPRMRPFTILISQVGPARNLPRKSKKISPNKKLNRHYAISNQFDGISQYPKCTELCDSNFCFDRNRSLILKILIFWDIFNLFWLFSDLWIWPLLRLCRSRRIRLSLSVLISDREYSWVRLSK